MRKKRSRETKTQVTCVQLKLNQVVTTDAVLRDSIFDWIKYVVDNLSRMTHEAYILANSHVIRCLTANVPLPKLDQSFFYSCLSGVSDTNSTQKDKEFVVSLDAHKQLRPVDFPIPKNKHLSKLMADVARQMETMFENSMIANTAKRIVRYVSLKNNLNRQEAEKSVRQCFKDESSELKDWLKFNPFYDDQIKKNTSHFVSVQWQILQFYETLENKRGSRRFSLLPLKGDFVYSFIGMSKSYLPLVLKLLDVKKREYIIEKLQKNEYHGDASAYVKQLKSGSFGHKLHKFEDVSRDLWKLIFPGAFKLETRNRKFAFRLSTNGYAASVTMDKPEKEKMSGALPLSFDGVDGYIGVDPGRTFMATSYDEKGNFIQISTGEYRHMAKMHDRTKWERRLRDRMEDYAEAIKDLPSLRVSSFDTFCQHARVILSKLEFLYQVGCEQAFRKWRFTVSRFAKKAMHQVAKRIIGDHKNPVIGLGDWSQQDGFLRGSPKAPVKKLKVVLQTMAKVVDVDEYCTSKTCSKCHAKVENARYDILKKKPKNGGETEKKKAKNGGETEKKSNVKCHEVVRCTNNACTIYWQRDKNASMNIFHLLQCMVEKKERPKAFQRRSW